MIKPGQLQIWDLITCAYVRPSIAYSEWILYVRNVYLVLQVDRMRHKRTAQKLQNMQNLLLLKFMDLAMLYQNHSLLSANWIISNETEFLKAVPLSVTQWILVEANRRFGDIVVYWEGLFRKITELLQHRWQDSRTEYALTMQHPLPAKVGTNFADKRRSLGRYSSLADYGHEI
jgi:hypothetical protein